MTTEFLFYHLQRRSLEQTLPPLLGKILQRGWRAVILTGSEERTEQLTQYLWTYDPASFLPHGNRKDGFSARQPIWLTATEENPNQAQVLVLTEGAALQAPESFVRVCDLFDGNDPGAVSAARTRWRRWRDAGHKLSYWQQEPGGKWSQKA